MNYLSSAQLVQQDLATRNCIITSLLKIKISCPKLSKDTYSNDYVNINNRDIPLRWSSHEAIFTNNWFSKSGVWSFGILVWEVLNQPQLPFYKKSDKIIFQLLKKNQLKLEISEKDVHFKSLLQV